jgi:hypothetical protein
MPFNLNSLFDLFKKQQNPGLVLDAPADIEKLPRHELFMGANDVQNVSWKAHLPSFRNQGSSFFCTAYAGTAIASVFESIERQSRTVFSPYELFYRSGGQQFGNYLISTADAMRVSIVLEADKPTPLVNGWNRDIWAKLRDGAKASDGALEFGKQFAVKSAALVKTDRESLRQALVSSPLMIAIGIGRNYWDPIVPKQSQYSAYHAVVLEGIDVHDNYSIFDSLAGRANFDGLHLLAPDYEILTALSFIDLPNGWQKKQQEVVEVKHANALDHYGKKRNLVMEQTIAAAFAKILKSHPTLLALAGRSWTTIINALTYGNYSITDILNHLTSLRRTGKGIFDFNDMR